MIFHVYFCFFFLLIFKIVWRSKVIGRIVMIIIARKGNCGPPHPLLPVKDSLQTPCPCTEWLVQNWLGPLHSGTTPPPFPPTRASSHRDPPPFRHVQTYLLWRWPVFKRTVVILLKCLLGLLFKVTSVSVPCGTWSCYAISYSEGLTVAPKSSRQVNLPPLLLGPPGSYYHSWTQYLSLLSSPTDA